MRHISLLSPLARSLVEYPLPVSRVVVVSLVKLLLLKWMPYCPVY